MLLCKKKHHGFQLCLYFCLLQMVLRHCDVGGIYYRYVDYCGEKISAYWQGPRRGVGWGVGALDPTFEQ